MDALVKALERRGATFEKSDEREFMHLRIGEEYLKIGLKDLVDKTEREPRDEQERQSWSWKRDKWKSSRLARLSFAFSRLEPNGAHRSWSDCTRHRLDEKLGEIVETIFITAEGANRARLAREEWRRQREEKWRRQEEDDGGKRRPGRGRNGNNASRRATGTGWRKVRRRGWKQGGSVGSSARARRS